MKTTPSISIPSEEEPFQKDSPLERIFHSPPARVLDFLVLNQKFDYSESDISKIALVAPRTLQRVIPELLEENLIVRTRKSGKAYMYMLNDQSERALKLREYVLATIRENLQNSKEQDVRSAAQIPGQQSLPNQ